MALNLIIPEKNFRKNNVKDFVFHLLAEEGPKTLTQLHKGIKREFGKSVSFQAVLKAVNYLNSYKILRKKQKTYDLDEHWISESRNFYDKLYTDTFKVKKPLKKVEATKNITVYIVSNLLELDRLWNDILTKWTKQEKQKKVNCWKGRHAWWLLPRLQEEDILQETMISQNIQTYNLWTENTILDKIASKYYSSKKVKSKIKKINTDKDEHISVFGNTTLKFTIPTTISKKLSNIYEKTKSLEKLDVKKIIDLFKESTEIELTIIEDIYIADKLKKEIMSNF